MKVKKWGWVIAIIAIAGSIYAAFQFGEQSPLYASGRVRLEQDLTESAANIHTLFITVYDEGSPMPMPYGAVRHTVRKRPKGTFKSFILTKDRLQVMNPSSPTPKTMRIKARLDRDGMGGMDQPGDLVGEVSGVPFGTTDIEIVIDTKVQGEGSGL